MPQIKAEKDAANQSESNRISFSISEDKYDAIYELYLKPGYYRGWSDFCYSAFRHFTFKFCEEMTSELVVVESSPMAGGGMAHLCFLMDS